MDALQAAEQLKLPAFINCLASVSLSLSRSLSLSLALTLALQLKCHQRKNKWQQFSINCICAKLSSILAKCKSAVWSRRPGPVAASVAPPRCWSSQTPLTLQLATITFSWGSFAWSPRHTSGGTGGMPSPPHPRLHRLLVFAPDRL